MTHTGIREKEDVKMTKIIMGIKLSQRHETAKSLQDILTRYGCIINTRLGVHEVSDQTCSEQGYILLEFSANRDDGAVNARRQMSYGELA